MCNARERRFEKREELYGWLDDLHGEVKFERKLCVHKNDSQKIEFVGDALKGWRTYIFPCIIYTPLLNRPHNVVQPLEDKLTITKDALARDLARFQATYPAKLLLAAKRARQHKIANKTRQRER